MNVTITLGGLAVGLALLIRQFLPSLWKHLPLIKGKTKDHPGNVPTGGKFDIREHTPFLVGTVVGMLAIASSGGVLGKAASWIVQGSNKLGDAALNGGAGAHSESVVRHSSATLTGPGSMVALLLTFVIVVLWKVIDKAMRKQMIGGVWCGSTLGLSAGAAGLLGSLLVPAANSAGAFLAGKL